MSRCAKFRYRARGRRISETLYDRIQSGDGKDQRYAYLSGVQTGQLDMAKSDAFRTIVDRAVELAKRSD